MLEVKGLTKVYKPKKGKPVTALKGIDLKFEETGMVFILGKSGSGKSTFLNLVGGLDSYTAGDIIIKGKSSHDFRQKDFDAYRNTYLGFIFQEYNILNEFTVGQNISLALELQGKKNDKEAVERLMKEVDLEGFYARKPFELSGGQKQRVAIARALVKDPEVIMADEPTGALDSATGKQVFETLQKLSKKKLVLIVSHDREYAEFYGDRVIEFKDGKVISDIKKHKTESRQLAGGNISVIGGSVIKIKKGYKLTPEEKRNIIDTIENSTENDTIISIDKRANADFMKVSRIDNDGNRESFEDIRESDLNIRPYDANKFRLKGSRFPNRYAFKMGASGLKGKPIRLIITILLCLVSFTLFGLADTIAAYDKYTVTFNSLRSTDVETFAIKKQYAVMQDGGYTSYYNETRYDSDGNLYFYDGYYSGAPKTMSITDLQVLQSKIDYADLTPLYGMPYADFSNNFAERNNGGIYYSNTFNSYCNEVNHEFLEEWGMKLLENSGSNYPVAANEILISKYTAESFVYNDFGYETFDESTGYHYEKFEIEKAEDIIGKTLTLRNDDDYTEKTVKIVGIVDTNFDEERYEDLKPSQNQNMSNDLMDMFIPQEFIDIITNSYHTTAFGGTGFAEYINDTMPSADDKTITAAMVNFAALSNDDANRLIKFIYDYKNELDINDFDHEYYEIGVSEVFAMQTPISSMMSMTNGLLEQLGQIFLWVGVGFAVFASLMLLNFISVSITHKKHEIGILRAIGAKSGDVYRIFFSESLIIAVITAILSSIAVGVLTMVINGALMGQGFLISILSFGIRQIALVCVVALLVSALATFIPTFKIARQKPIDAIKK